MGLVFDNDTARTYEAWCRTPQGRAIDHALERLIPPLLDPKRGERVLDIGCGTGNHLIILQKLGLNISGVDASRHMIDRARERLGPRCALQRAHAEDLPFEDNEFDLAVLINTLEFLDHPAEALREAGRVARRSVFVGAINGLSWSGLSKRVQGYLGDPVFSHARFFSLWQLMSLLKGSFGNVPVSWGSTPLIPGPAEYSGLFAKMFRRERRSLFGSFLGVSATMFYRMRTQNLLLRTPLKEAKPSALVGARTLPNCNRRQGARRNERSLLV